MAPQDTPINDTANETGPYKLMFIGPESTALGFLKSTISTNKRLDLDQIIHDGTNAVSVFRKNTIDAIVCDLSAKNIKFDVTIRRLLKIDPKVKIILISPSSADYLKRADEAILSGALEHMTLPESGNTPAIGRFTSDLHRQIVDYTRTRRKEGDRPQLNFTPKPLLPPKEVTLIAASTITPAILVIGSSTGGPNALQTVFAGLPASFDAPILITQHMPPTFTPVLATNMSKKTGRKVAEGIDGEPVIKGRVYVAPGDFHMIVEDSADGPVIRLNQGPPENSCRPSVDPMFRSAAKVYKNKILAVVLTGMGTDGAKGSVPIANAGSTVIAQDFDTSVVWGMPGATVALKHCAKVLPIDQIAPYIVKKFS